MSPPKRSPHRANGEGETNRRPRRLDPATVPVKSAVVDFLKQASFSAFQRAFPHLFAGNGPAQEHSTKKGGEK
jgi:hypothetical protein